MTRLTRPRHDNRLERAPAAGLSKGDSLGRNGRSALSREEVSLFFRLLVRRYEWASPIVTANKSFLDWSEIFRDHVIATAILDRLHHPASAVDALRPVTPYHR